MRRLAASRLFLCLTSLLVMSGCSTSVQSQDSHAVALSSSEGAGLVTAHRGSLHTGQFPENSLPALREAVAAQVPLLEVDVRLSEQGDLFLFHDSKITLRNSFAPTNLLGRRIETLQRTERRYVHLDRPKTIPIPTLLEAMDVIRGTSATLQLDPKEESDRVVAEIYMLARTRDQLQQIILQLRSSERVRWAAKNFPKLRVLARCVDETQLQHALSAGVEFVELERWLQLEAIARAHRQGVKVVVNVSASEHDTPERWRELRAMGVDSIMTDRPLEALPPPNQRQVQ